MKKYIKLAFIKTIPIMAGYVFLGIAFGLLMRNQGYPAWYPVIMSLVIYSGALEFAAIPLLAAPFDPLGSFALGLMISARHLFYGIPVLERYSTTGAAKPFLIFGLTDETFSLLTSPEFKDGKEPRVFLVLITLFNFLYWNTGTLLGSLAGNFLTMKLEGLDFALTALFIVLFVEQIRNREGLISGFTGLLASAAVLCLVGSGRMVILSMAAILILLLCERRVIHSD